MVRWGFFSSQTKPVALYSSKCWKACLQPDQPVVLRPLFRCEVTESCTAAHIPKTSWHSLGRSGTHQHHMFVSQSQVSGKVAFYLVLPLPQPSASRVWRCSWLHVEGSALKYLWLWSPVLACLAQHCITTPFLYGRATARGAGRPATLWLEEVQGLDG